MFVNKIGKAHLVDGRNCQDFGMVSEGKKLVCDGCSEGRHTEVGAKGFVHLIQRGYGILEAFERLLELFGQRTEDIHDFLCFTILMVEEDKKGFRVFYCGDGYVMLEDLEGRMQYHKLSDGEYPRYLAYNYVEKHLLKYYQEGVKIRELYFSKEQYQRVGVATDGLRFLEGMEEMVQKEFERAFLEDREMKIRRLINKYQIFFQDDVTIAW